ncbi:MAG: hypothetical protein ACI9C2_001988, partial [Gammaproteobacteria bacterium]
RGEWFAYVVRKDRRAKSQGHGTREEQVANHGQVLG